jgi:hypothetical protein
MTRSRLSERLAAPTFERNPHTFGTQEWCGWQNIRLTRRDIEWAPTGNGGVFLRDRQEWSTEHGRKGEERAERERKDFNHRQRYPVAAVPQEPRP